MTKPTLSTRIRAIQDELSAITGELSVIQDDAHHIRLAPSLVANIEAAIDDNQHAWTELNHIATALELTGQGAKP